MSLLSAVIVPFLRVPSVGEKAWTSVPLPEPGNALNWGDRITLTVNPKTDPHGEQTSIVHFARWDGGERTAYYDKRLRYWVIDGDNIPVWPIRLDVWRKNGYNQAWVVPKEAEDRDRHRIEYGAYVTSADGTQEVTATVDYEMS